MDKLFYDLFVLEMANNHWGDVDRGLKIIDAFSHVVRFNNVKAAIKLQFRDVDAFIHKDFRNSDLRYVKKTLATKLSVDDYAVLVNAVRQAGCMTMATPFDEVSVSLCDKLAVDMIKIAHLTKSGTPNQNLNIGLFDGKTLLKL